MAFSHAQTHETSPLRVENEFNGLNLKCLHQKQTDFQLRTVQDCNFFRQMKERELAPEYYDDVGAEKRPNSTTTTEKENYCMTIIDPIFQTTYTVFCIEEHELPVIGTYVHEAVTPGFHYRVRRAVSADSFLWQGEARRLLSIGMGYGKRITFELGDDLDLDPTEYYMYSDTEEQGFAFSLSVPKTDGAPFIVCDEGGRELASVTLSISWSGRILQTPTKSSHTSNDTEAKLMCGFTCRVSTSMSLNSGRNGLLDSPLILDCPLQGTAELVRRGGGSKSAILSRITGVQLPGHTKQVFSLISTR